MAKKREPVKPVEPESESDEASSEEVEASESESEQTAAQKKSKPQATPPPQQQPASSSEEEEEEEESGSESESESDVPESNVVKPLAFTNVSKKTASETKVPEPEPPTKASSSAAKRPADFATPTKDSKKKKTAEPVPEPETAEKKSNIFQRLWTEDDEIAILKGMSDYSSKKKSDPMADLNSFHDFIKKKLHADFTKTQLQDKIRRLKKKFVNNNGKRKVLSKPHEQVLYDLSNVIWGNEPGKEIVHNGSVVSKKTAGTAEPVVKNTLFGTEKVNLGSGIDSGEEHMFATGRWLFESGRGFEGESEWNDLQMEDLKLFQRRLEVRLMQTKLVMDVMKDVMNRGDQ